MTTTLIILVPIAFFVAGYLCALTRNKARMTKLASSNIDLIKVVEKWTNIIKIYEAQRSELIIRCSNIVESNNQLKQENEELRQTTDELLKDVDRYRGLSQQYEFQIQQFNIAKEPCKPTEQ